MAQSHQGLTRSWIFKPAKSKRIGGVEDSANTIRRKTQTILESQSVGFNIFQLFRRGAKSRARRSNSF